MRREENIGMVERRPSGMLVSSTPSARSSRCSPRAARKRQSQPRRAAGTLIAAPGSVVVVVADRAIGANRTERGRAVVNTLDPARGPPSTDIPGWRRETTSAHSGPLAGEEAAEVTWLPFTNVFHPYINT